MTAEQFKGWLEGCSMSPNVWRLDATHNGQDGADSLFYKPCGAGKPGAGYYVLERGEGFLEIGTYEHATPHIGEGVFHFLGRKQYANRQEALSRAVQAGIALPLGESPTQRETPALAPSATLETASVPEGNRVRTITVSTRFSSKSIKTGLGEQEALRICRGLQGFGNDLARQHQRWNRLSTNQWNWVLYLAQEHLDKQARPQEPRQEQVRPIPAIPAPTRTQPALSTHSVPPTMPRGPEPIGVSLNGEEGMEKVMDLIARGRKAGLVRPKIYLVVKGEKRNRFYFLSPAKKDGWLWLREKGGDKRLGSVSSDGLLLPGIVGLEGRHPGLVEALRKLTADPEASMKEYASLTHSCMFCNRTLTDERSIQASCGQDCAIHYGVKWGQEPTKKEMACA